MRELRGKTAFITGGASGIGLAMGRAFAKAGMQVMLADIEAETLHRAAESLARDGGGAIRSVLCDVTDPTAVERAAQATIDAFGKVHLVCNNAGVGGSGGIDDISLKSWRWVIDVNLMGVVHGVRAFLPLLRAHGEGGHIVNTASMAGFLPGTGFGPYAATKFAVEGISEALAMELAPHGIGVSVLCPGWVNTRILESARNWPAEYGPPPTRELGPLADRIAELVKSGMSPDSVAELVLNAVTGDQFYIFTHPHMRPPLEQRFARVLEAYRKLGPAPQEQAR